MLNPEVSLAFNLTVIFPGMEEISARRVTIRAFADRKPELPAGMTARPERSRFLEAITKKYEEEHRILADALSFGGYGKAGDSDV